MNEVNERKVGVRRWEIQGERKVRQWPVMFGREMEYGQVQEEGD
jgi:hypothetical protein